MTETLLDSYVKGNYDYDNNLVVVHPAAGSGQSACAQTFTTPNDGVSYKITSAKFYLKKYSTPTGTLVACLYAISGTYGTNSKPTGSALATSDTFNTATLTSSMQLITFTFSGAQQYQMTANTHYAITIQIASGTVDTNHYVTNGCDHSTPNHGGELSTYSGGAWTQYTGYDTIFYAYGNPSLTFSFNETLTLTTLKTFVVTISRLQTLSSALTISFKRLFSFFESLNVLPSSLTFKPNIKIAMTLQGVSSILKYLSKTILGTLTGSSVVSTRPATGSQWLTGWSHRKQHTIIHATGAGSGYQIPLTVYWGSGSDNGEMVYLNGESRFDFDDVKVTQSDGQTVEGIDFEKVNFFKGIKYSGNPVLSDANTMFPCSVLKVGATYYMYISGYDVNSTRCILRSTSSDGISWGTKTPVFYGSQTAGKFDENYVAAHVVWIENGTWYMFYSGFSGGTSYIQAGGYATSADGITWNIQNGGNACIQGGGVGTWDYKEVECFGMMKVDATYYLYYNTLNWHAPRQVGVATSTDLIHWTKDPNNPIITASTEDNADFYGFYCACPFKCGDKYYLLCPHEYHLGSSANLELFMDTDPRFLATSRTRLGIFIKGAVADGDGNECDTPCILTADISREINTMTELKIYYAAKNAKFVANLISDVKRRLWVKITDSLETDDAIIYLYFGKNDAVDPSDGANTWIIYDDFTGVTPLDNWTATVGSANDWEKAASVYGASLHHKLTGDAYYLLTRNNYTVTNMRMMCVIVPSLGSLLGPYTYGWLSHRIVDSTNWYYEGYFDDSTYTDRLIWEKRVNSVDTVLASPATQDSHNFGFAFEVTALDSAAKMYRDGTLVTNTTNTQFLNAGMVGLSGYKYDTWYLYFRIGKFVDPEPQNSTWETEETPFSIKFLFETLQTFLSTSFSFSVLRELNLHLSDTILSIGVFLQEFLYETIQLFSSRISQVLKSVIGILGFADNQEPETLIDSCSEVHQNINCLIGRIHEDDYLGIGQTFTNLNNNSKLKSVKFYLNKAGLPTGNAVAKLYTMTGTYGIDGKPTGEALAVSDTFDVASLTGSYVLRTLTFSGINQYVMSPNAHYVITFEYSNGDLADYVYFGSIFTGQYHDGNRCTSPDGSTWEVLVNRDSPFYVYGALLSGNTFFKVNIDTMTFGDLLTSAFTLLNKYFYEVLSLSSSRIMSIHQTIKEDLHSVNLFVFGNLRRLVENLSFLESRILKVSKANSENLNLLDLLGKFLLITLSLNETLVFLFSFLSRIRKTLSESPLLNSYLSLKAGMTRTEILNLNDAWSRIFYLYFPILYETLMFSSSIIKNIRSLRDQNLLLSTEVMKKISRDFLETITMLDEALKRKIIKLVEGMAHSADIIAMNVRKVLNVFLGFPDVVGKKLSRGYQENLYLSDIYGATRRFIYSETMQFVEVSSRLFKKVNAMTLRISDFYGVKATRQVFLEVFSLQDDLWTYWRLLFKYTVYTKYKNQNAFSTYKALLTSITTSQSYLGVYLLKKIIAYATGADETVEKKGDKGDAKLEGVLDSKGS